MLIQVIKMHIVTRPSNDTYNSGSVNISEKCARCTLNEEVVYLVVATTAQY